MIRLVSKEITFEAAHRLAAGYPGNCRHVHGHSWVVTITMQLQEDCGLNKYGFVRDYADFTEIKDWIMDHWDHAMLVSKEDKVMVKFLKQNKQRHFIFETNPTSENIAQFLLTYAESQLDDSRSVVTEVKVKETCTSEAVIRIDMDI